MLGQGWTSAGELHANQELWVENGHHVTVRSVRASGHRVNVYNFTVQGWHSYLVGPGVLVHNNCLFENQLPTLLSSELATATRVGATPIAAGTPAFADAINQGTIKWVVTEAGELLISPHTIRGVEISHAVLSGGRPVQAAGVADIAGAGARMIGLEIHPNSGHFRPSDASVQLGRDAFARFGIRFPQ